MDYKDGEALLPLFDAYYSSPKEQVYRDYYHQKEFVDCKGCVYKVVDRKTPESFWRNLFYFIPGVYKVELIFQNTYKTMDVVAVKNNLIQGIRKFDTSGMNDVSEEWIQQIKKANTIKEILMG